MWRFSKGKPREVWDEPIGEAIGDIEAAKKIRVICRAATDSAHRVADAAGRDGKTIKHDIERYERAARAAMEIAIKVSDELMRDAAVRQIIELCMTANDEKTARPLLRAIRTGSIREDVLKNHPSLKE
ncbi:hypothetical protein JQ628_27620 [Bradyrhizobium lablabi]|uniref:hypothetical protein n=1 Tax=Bradyrhizobium lablabi TaxID=722472 RepID=UPI001BA57652|nr:hypothetical protein [Bradyrhizobium lablabi]MBR1125319.1 hypothetical protein [Bradyrhizobium lablabi]